MRYYDNLAASGESFGTKMAEVTGSGEENATTFYYDVATVDRCTSLVGTGKHADVTLAMRVLDARGQDLTDAARDARKTCPESSFLDTFGPELVIDPRHAR